MKMLETMTRPELEVAAMFDASEKFLEKGIDVNTGKGLSALEKMDTETMRETIHEWIIEGDECAA